MRKIRGVLRLKLEQNRGHREIAASCGIGVATVSEYLRRARDSCVSWEVAHLRISRFRERSDRRYVNTRIASRERRDRRHVNARLGHVNARIGHVNGEIAAM